jgi:hypothetical protein
VVVASVVLVVVVVESVVALVVLSLLQAINPKERKVIRLKISFFIIKVLIQPYYLQK